MENGVQKLVQSFIGIHIAAFAAGLAFTLLDGLLSGIIAFTVTLFLAAALVHHKHSD